jgi:hypothetical protein
MTRIAATLVILLSTRLLEKEPNTCPMINTIQATNSILIKIMNPKLMVYNLKGSTLHFSHRSGLLLSLSGINSVMIDTKVGAMCIGYF